MTPTTRQVVQTPIGVWSASMSFGVTSFTREDAKLITANA
jgi:hypothetical protein